VTSEVLQRAIRTALEQQCDKACMSVKRSPVQRGDAMLVLAVYGGFMRNEGSHNLNVEVLCR
jgi:hypothetical protein